MIIPLVAVELEMTAQDRAAKQSVLTMALGTRAAAQVTIDRLRHQLGMPDEVPPMPKPDATVISLLREVEWGGRSNPYHHICPICGASRAIGHEQACRLAQVLA